MKSIWTGGIIILIIALAVFWYTRGDDSSGTATTTPRTAPTFEDGAGGPSETFTDGSYELDTEESSVAWTGSKTLVLNYKDNGTIAFSSGTVTVQNGAITSGVFTVDMNSLRVLSTSNTKAPGSRLETHLKSDDFFDVALYPTASIVLTSVVEGMVTADVTMKNITKSVTFPATIRQEEEVLVGTGNLTINRTDWGVRYGSDSFFDDLGNNVIDDDVEIFLTLRAVRTE